MPHISLAAEALSAGHRLQAVALCRYALTVDPWSCEANRIWVQLSLATGRKGYLLKLLFKFIALFLKKGEQRIRLAHKALSYFPTWPWALRFLAKTARAQGAQPLACFAYETLSHSHNIEDRLNLCFQYIDEPKKLLLAAEEGLQEHPHSTELQHYLQQASIALMNRGG